MPAPASSTMRPRIVAPAFSSTLTWRSPPASTIGKLGARPLAITDRTLGIGHRFQAKRSQFVGRRLGNAVAADTQVPAHHGFRHGLAIRPDDRAGDGPAVHRLDGNLRGRSFGRFGMEDEIDRHRTRAIERDDVGALEVQVARAPGA